MSCFKTLISSALAFTVLTSTASAGGVGPLFLATNGNTLYRGNIGGIVETFPITDVITGLSLAPDGRIFASSSTVVEGGSTLEIYELLNVFSEAPTIVTLSDQLPFSFSAIDFVGETLYGFRSTDNALYTIDTNTFQATLVGDTLLGTGSAGGAGYDPFNDTLYLGVNSNDSLYTVDYNPAPGADPVATLVGSFGIDAMLDGFDFNNGSLYAAIQDSTGLFTLGSMDTQTGAYSSIMTLDAQPAGGAVGLVIIPSPPAVSLGLLALLGVNRRRR